MKPRHAFYAQSGGVTAVINASACGVIETARLHPERIGTVYAGLNGILGALHEELIDTSQESAAAIRALRYTPAGAFGSARYKLKGLEENRAEYQRLIDVFRAHDIGYFFYNGGGDSQDTAHKVAQMGARMGYPLVAIGIPKTVDNDLPGTDCCPGFGSAAKYLATSLREAAYDVASMAKTSTRVFILEVMGRHAGWLTAACGLAFAEEEAGPLILLFPERTFEPHAFVQRVQQNVQQYGYCVVAVSEGIRSADGKFLADSGLRDAFGHAQLGGVAPRLAQWVRDELGLKYHWAVADYLQRSARHLASRTDVRQAYAVGRAAVNLALKGVNAVMPVVLRLSDAPYRWRVGHVPLAQVANQERPVPAEFISADGFSITSQARAYLKPLILGEDYPPYREGLPDYVHLKKTLVSRRLPPFAS